jgi:hypothetical protein
MSIGSFDLRIMAKNGEKLSGIKLSGEEVKSL